VDVGSCGEVVVVLALGWLMTGVVEVRVGILAEATHAGLVQQAASLLQT